MFALKCKSEKNHSIYIANIGNDIANYLRNIGKDIANYLRSIGTM